MKTTTSDGISIDYSAYGPKDSTKPTLVLTTAFVLGFLMGHGPRPTQPTRPAPRR